LVQLKSSVFSFCRRLRTAVRLFVTGRWQELLRRCWDLRRRIVLRLRGVDLGFVSREEAGVSTKLHGDHSITPGPDLEKVLQRLDIGPEAKIIDIGCGKGSALITMATFPFSRIAGCDISADLVAVAKTNLARLGIKGVMLYCCDATKFGELDDYNYIYFFNPFAAEVFESVMANVRDSLARSPRDLTIIYRNPKSHHVIVAGSLFEKTREFHYGTLPFFVYVHRHDSD